ncbi:MAG: DUF3326 domain-containing protein [bacterium]
MIKQKEIVLKKTDIKSALEIPNYLDQVFNGKILRWFISKISEENIHIELTLYDNEILNCNHSYEENEVINWNNRNTVVLNVVPTGIGCSIGGYAGDAAPANALLASCTDHLITHPNTVNASNFIHKTENTHYLEGFFMDLFSKGLVDLYEPFVNNVGLIIEKTSQENLDIIYNIVNACRAVYGINISHCEVTDEYVGGRCVRNKSGAYVGNIDNPQTLFRAAEKLIKKGITAIGITSNIKDLPQEEYAKHFDGKSPNPVGGVEAIISHLVSKKYQLPAAHAPMINKKDITLFDQIVDARGSAEMASISGLACVIIGLNKAPQINSKLIRVKHIINKENLLAVVAPANSLGGVPMIYANRRNIPLIAVRNNETILEINKKNLNLKNVIEVENYFEAAGVIQAIKSGINLDTIKRPMKTLRKAK